MTAQEAEPGELAPRNSFGHFAVRSYLAGTMTVTSDPVVLDPYSREIEVPPSSPVFATIVRHALDGGFLYLTRHGRRVAAIVPVEVADNLEEEDSDRDRQADLQELLDEAEGRLGPVPPEIQAEVDRLWATAASL